MKLRAQSLWFLLLSAGGFFLLVTVVSLVVLLPAADRTDRDEMERVLLRFRSRIAQQVKQVEVHVNEYGPWTDTFLFLQNLKPEYLESNFSSDSMGASGMNLVAAWDGSGRRVLERAHENGAEGVTAVPEAVMAAIEAWPGLAQRSLGQMASGVLLTPRGPLLFAASPITRDDRGPPVVGTFLSGQWLDAQRISQITAGEAYVFELMAPVGDQPGERPGRVRILDGERMRAILVLEDPDRRAAAQIAVVGPRFVHLAQVRSLRVLFSCLGVGGLVLVVAAWYLLRGRFLRRIEALTRDVAHLDTDAAIRLRLAAEKVDDEVGLLAGAIGRSAIALAEAREVAEAATRTKGEFLATMSHEIRTPLNGVIGYLGLLRGSGLTPEQIAHVDVIRESGDGLLKVINEILDYSKLESGRVALESTPVDLRAIATEVLALFEPRLRAKGVRSSLVVSDAVPARVLADPTRLRQVLSNLVSNAEKFTAAGEVAVRIEVDGGGAPEHRGEIPPFQLRFSVRDTGIGLSVEQAANLFQPFVQADSTTTRRFGGTGLGLSICRRLVRAWGGDLTVEGRPGEGCTFTFTLVASSVPAETGVLAKTVDVAREVTANGLIPDKRRDETAAKAHASAVGELRILIAEDNAVNARLLTAVLARLGARAERVEDGMAALIALRERAYDLVLMDVQMPVLDGLETTRRLRVWERENNRPRMHVTALTANALTGSREECLAAGMDDYLSKPFLIEQVHRVLEGAVARRAFVGVDTVGPVR